MGSERSLHMEPSPLPVLTDSSSEGLAPDAEGMKELDRVYSTDSLEQFFASRLETEAPQCIYPFKMRTQEETGSTRRL